MAEVKVSPATAICLDCAEEFAGEVDVKLDPDDYRMGMDVCFAEGGVLSDCKQHHDQHRWGPNSTQHSEFLIADGEENPVGTVVVSTEARAVAISSVCAYIKSALLGQITR